MEIKTYEGVIQYYFPFKKDDRKGGYGFIVPIDKLDELGNGKKIDNIFFHSSNSSIHETNIEQGIKVLYSLEIVEIEGVKKKRATNVRRVVG